jgi:anhydro-N-acetylmuramic acid kinase
MTGTSADGVDAVLVNCKSNIPTLVERHFHPYPCELQKRVLAITHQNCAELDELFLLDRAIAGELAAAVTGLLSKSCHSASAIIAIGSHGQTIRHRPNPPFHYTVQIGDPNTLVAKTGISVITDFRRADMAHHGQGAPFASLFHKEVFHQPGKCTAVLNLGGIANITLLSDDTPVIGFDTGPANALLDNWIELNKGLSFDKDGEWASTGKVDKALLEAMLKDPYFHLPSPKSTGREYFNPVWTQHHIQHINSCAKDIQATLCELTAVTVAQAIKSKFKHCHQVFLCGGGAKNKELLRRLKIQLPHTHFLDPKTRGIEGDFLEAIVFAWLAKRHIDGLPGNLPSVTGSSKAVISGCYYPATP